MVNHPQIRRLARWGFPLLSVAALVATQVLVPRILQLEFGDAEYVAYVAVVAIAAYIGLADAGLQFALTRELSAVHASEDHARYAAEVHRARAVFTGIGVTGAMIAVLAFFFGYPTIRHAWAGADALSFQLAVAFELLAVTAMVSVGGFFAVVCYSSGRLFLGQVVGFVVTFLPILALIAGLAVTRSLTSALVGHAGTIASLALMLVFVSRRMARHEIRGAAPSKPLNSFRDVLSGGIAIRFADVLPAATFPHVLSVFAAAYVPAAVPARTFVGLPRMVVQQFLGLLNVHVTRRLAGSDESRRHGLAQYRAAATFLTAIHLVGVGLSALIVGFVFRLWLPMRAGEVALYLPGMLAEQALMAASLPSTIMFTALGQLRLLGSLRLIGVLLGVGVFVLVLPYADEAAFGYGLATSALPLFFLGFYSEVASGPGFPKTSTATTCRYVFAATAAMGCTQYAAHPHAVAAGLALAGTLLLPRPALALWRMFNGVLPLEA